MCLEAKTLMHRNNLAKHGVPKIFMPLCSVSVAFCPFKITGFYQRLGHIKNKRHAPLGKAFHIYGALSIQGCAVLCLI